MFKEKSKLSGFKNTYFTQVENKYVFNVSLFFWHFFIAVSTLIIVASLLVFIWSILPASQSDVKKQPYPEPVKVTLSDLQFNLEKEENLPSVPQQFSTTTIQQPIEDLQGKGEYDVSLSTIKTLIPPSKYSWEGSGYWSYPYGERYWTVYKQERYRQWNTTEPGIEDKLRFAYQRAHALKYPDRKIILDGYISVVKLLPETKRLEAVQYLIDNVAYNVSQNVNVCQSLAKVVDKIHEEENISYLNQLAFFGKRNINDGYLFIDYAATIMDKFDTSIQPRMINQLIDGYYNYFNQNLTMLKEATDLFLPLLPQIKTDDQLKAIMQYYGVFRSKNYARDNAITQIENQYRLDQMDAEREYFSDKMAKSEYRIKSLVGVGGGILLIVLIATVLVFFSIQRSVRAIEEKILLTGEKVNE